MDFNTMIKEGLKEKYLNMLEEKTQTQGINVSIQSTEEFLAKFNRLYQSEKTKEAKKEEAKNKISQKTKIFAGLAYISPIILAIIFAFILFINKKQISIRFSSFGVWCALWVIFTIIVVIISFIILAKQKNFKKSELKISSIIFTVLSCIALIIVIPFACKLTPNFNPTRYITINVNSKTTSRSYSQYVTTLSFTVKNESDIEINYFCGNMDFYNGDYLICSKEVYWEGSYEPGQTYDSTLDITMSDDHLYSTDFENLAISYKITSMRFNNYSTEYTFDELPIIIKEITN